MDHSPRRLRVRHYTGEEVCFRERVREKVTVKDGWSGAGGGADSGAEGNSDDKGASGAVQWRWQWRRRRLWAGDLAADDVVLVSYEVLRREMYHEVLRQKDVPARGSRGYGGAELYGFGADGGFGYGPGGGGDGEWQSALMQCGWWRLALDEAQMTLGGGGNSAASATALSKVCGLLWRVHTW
jgi:hypothetical protein